MRLPVDVVILDDTTVDINLPLIHSNLVFITEKSSYFFKRKALGIGKEEPHAQSSERPRNNETEIEFPADFSSGY